MYYYLAADLEAAFADELTCGIVTEGCFMHQTALKTTKWINFVINNSKYGKIWLEFVDKCCSAIPLSSFKNAVKPDLVPKTKNRMIRSYLASLTVFVNIKAVEEYWSVSRRTGNDEKGVELYLLFCSNKIECLQIGCTIIMILEVKHIYIYIYILFLFVIYISFDIQYFYNWIAKAEDQQTGTLDYRIRSVMQFITDCDIYDVPQYTPAQSKQFEWDMFKRIPSTAKKDVNWQQDLLKTWIRTHKMERQKYRIWKDDDPDQNVSEESAQYSEEVLNFRINAVYNYDDILQNEIVPKYNLDEHDIKMNDESWQELIERRDVEKRWDFYDGYSLEDMECDEVIEDVHNIFFEAKHIMFHAFIINAPESNWEALVSNPLQMNECLTVYGVSRKNNYKYYLQWLGGLDVNQFDVEENIDVEEPTPQSFGIYAPGGDSEDDESYIGDIQLNEEYQGFTYSNINGSD